MWGPGFPVLGPGIPVRCIPQWYGVIVVNVAQSGKKMKVPVDYGRQCQLVKQI